jgi:hypothetical protein
MRLTLLQVLHKVREQAEARGRFFAVEYDLSGQAEDTPWSEFSAQLDYDYKNVVAPLFASDSYIYSEGRPVIEIWGVGTGSGSGSLNGASFLKIVQQFQGYAEKPWIVLGVPSTWADFETKDPGSYWPVYKIAQAIQPWPVGVYESVSTWDSYVKGNLIPGKAKADSMGLKFGGTATPMGSNRNPSRTNTNVPALGNRYVTTIMFIDEVDC